jgi:rRNA processing protein Krr1/Pno1
MRESGGDEIRMPVPANRTGAVIGRGGETIRQLKQQSGCEIELDKNAKIGPGDDKVFIIRGPSDRIQYAQQLINDKVQGNSSNEGNSNNYGASSGDYAWPANYFQQESSSQSNEAPSNQDNNAQSQWAAYYAQYYQSGAANPGGHAQQQPQQPDAAAGAAASGDYSAQWAEYYRAYGMHKEAEMIEQYAKNGGQGQPPNGSGGHDDKSGDKSGAPPVAYPGYNYGSSGGGYGGGSRDDKH